MTIAPHTLGARFSIRDYRPADFDVLWEIDQHCFPEGISYSRLELNGFLTRRNAISLVAELDRPPASAASAGSSQPDDQPRIAGFVVAHSVRQKCGRILTLDIVPEMRRFGLGSELMLACEQRLRGLGCREVYLETAVNNEAALRLYGKLGYEVFEILPEYYASHALDAFRMAKRL